MTRDPDPDRVMDPALVFQLAAWVAGVMRNMAREREAWPEVDPDDASELEEYLFYGPTDRIPDDATALVVLQRVSQAINGPGWTPFGEPDGGKVQ